MIEGFINDNGTMVPSWTSGTCTITVTVNTSGTTTSRYAITNSEPVRPVQQKIEHNKPYYRMLNPKKKAW